MRKIDLSEFKVMVDGEATPYETKESLVNVLFAKGSGGTELMKRHAIANKILNGGETLLLEDAEYAIFMEGFNTVTSFGRNDVEFVRRILDAEKVEVVEAPNETA
jgi:hypothetical protein